jgi:bifunctional UDP-N-acetylglucosamine pyrophosphorylase/glucosamine-1-phosphate N-acetyltransferase
MTKSSALAIVLAAGKGTRMKSARPKVLHKLAGAPMLHFVLKAVAAAGIARTALVVGPGMEEVSTAATALDPSIMVFVQEAQAGTADAVKAARRAFETSTSPVLILFSDTPLLRSESIAEVALALEEGADLVVVGFQADDPTGYGRLLLDGKNRLIGIREERDASPEERAIKFCNSGIMGFRSSKVLGELLGGIGNQNAKGEFYLTDAVGLACEGGLKTWMVRGQGTEVLGVNSRSELAQAEAAVQARLRAAAMAHGAMLIAPETIFLSHDTVIGSDVLIEPNVIIGPGVVIEDRATIRGFCHIDGARIGADAIVGPFARLRPGARIAPGAHVGNFVEIKQAEIGEGAKVNHLTYIGDASVGPHANIGAGTITCNYDGFGKHRTEIGANAFIGSNTSLVAPLKVGDGAYVGSGSVITKDVAPDALALTRSPQMERPGWAAANRERRGKGIKRSGNNEK